MNNSEEKNKWYHKIIELFELPEFLSVIERDEKGNPIKVSGFIENSPNRLRIAENEKDFEEICNREIKKHNISNKYEIDFLSYLKDHMKQLIRKHDKNIEYKNIHYKSIFIAKDFINHIETKISPTNQNSTNEFKWYGTQTEFIELVKALIENGNLKGTQKDIISTFSNLFNLEIKNPDKLIQDIKNRNIGSETLFLDRLKTSLYDCIKK